MKTLAWILLLIMVTLGTLRLPAQAQDGLSPGINVPDTSIENPFHRGVRAHTNHLVLGGRAGGLGPAGGMIPTQMWSFYGIIQTTPPSGGANVIAIVDAYHYPTALADFNVFSSSFGLPVETSSDPQAPTNTVFQVVYANGAQPVTDGGWAQEAALDIEWAHAMAPTAKIVLVEAASNGFADLFAAVDAATKLPGVKEVSMSWSGGEFSTERNYDSHFASSSVVYFASSGDTGGTTQYPAASPNVVAVGGTSVATNSSGAFLSETGWNGSGGGSSRYEPKPSYQQGVSGTPSKARGIPDISSDADPKTGVCVYDSTPYGGASGWMVFGGTSVSSPCMAGMVNRAGHFFGGSTAQLTAIYGSLNTPYLRDIVSGKAGRYKCTRGWDFVTGVGAPIGPGGI